MAEKNSKEINSEPQQPWKELVKNTIWPVEPAARAKVKTKYRNVGIFILVSTVLYRYGKQLAALIYDQDELQDTVRMAMR